MIFRRDDPNVRAIQAAVAERSVFQADRGEVPPVVGSAIVRLAERSAQDAKRPYGWLRHIAPKRYERLTAEAAQAARLLTALGELASGLTNIQAEMHDEQYVTGGGKHRVGQVAHATITVEIPSSTDGKTQTPVTVSARGGFGGNFTYRIPSSDEPVSRTTLSVMAGAAEFAARTERVRSGSHFGVPSLGNVAELLAVDLAGPDGSSPLATTMSSLNIVPLELDRTPVVA